MCASSKQHSNSEEIVTEQHPIEIKIAYIGGGSRYWAQMIMADLALTPELTGEIALYDIDHEAAARNVERAKDIYGHPDARVLAAASRPAAAAGTTTANTTPRRRHRKRTQAYSAVMHTSGAAVSLSVSAPHASSRGSNGAPA